MEQIFEQISKQDECKKTDIMIKGDMFKRFITPFVEITLAVGKINPQKLDPLMIVSPKGAFFIAKTVREKGDGEGSVFFLTKKITSPITSYICMDFDEHFLKFCRNVRKKDEVKVHFDREFYFINKTRRDEQSNKDMYSEGYSKWIYKARANNIEDIRKEVQFSLKLMAEIPKKWTAKLEIPAREIKKFYINVWRFLHRAVFFHKVIDNNALVASYSEDALRDLFSERWGESGFTEPIFETPKRRFFMSRHFVSGEDGVKCQGEGRVIFRANWRILKDIAQSGLDFELNFSDFTTPYGIVVRDNDSCFMQICENTFENPELVQSDFRKTLENMSKMDYNTIHALENEKPCIMCGKPSQIEIEGNSFCSNECDREFVIEKK